MEKFQLCYSPAHAKYEIIIPALLGEAPPRHDFDRTRAWAFRFRFVGFMPPHILPTVFVDRHEEIHEDEIWQFGARLKPSRYLADALIEGNFLDRTITIYVSGAQANDYLGILRDRINKAIDRMKHLRRHEEIELTSDMRVRGSSGVDLEQEVDNIWADYQQVRANIDDKDPRFVAPGGAVYNLSRLEPRLPRNEDISRVLQAFDTIENDLIVYKFVPEVLRDLRTLRNSILGKDLNNADTRKKARVTLQGVLDRTQKPLEILGKIKGANEGLDIITNLLRQFARLLGMVS